MISVRVQNFWKQFRLLISRLQPPSETVSGRRQRRRRRHGRHGGGDVREARRKQSETPAGGNVGSFFLWHSPDSASLFEIVVEGSQPSLAYSAVSILSSDMSWNVLKKLETESCRTELRETSRSNPCLNTQTEFASSLRRRFLQNQLDCKYTILALVPTMGERIIDEMDVEAITHAVQLKSAASRAPSEAPSTGSLSLNNVPLPNTSTIDLVVPEHDLQSEPGSSVSGDQSPAPLGESSLSWVEQFTGSASDNQISNSPTWSSGPQLSDSIHSASVSLISASEQSYPSAVSGFFIN